MIEQNTDVIGGRKEPKMTIMEVARRIGVSPATVSLVLTRSPECCPIRAETRKTVMDAVKKLGYRANWRAQALAQKRTKIIGMIHKSQVPYLSGLGGVIFDAVSCALNERDYHLLFIPVNDEDGRWKNLVSLDRIDGVLVTCPAPIDLKLLIENRIPSVLMNSKMDIALSQVIPDDFDGAMLLTRHLISLEHKRITYVHTRDDDWHSSIDLRKNGYVQAMREANLGEFVDTVEKITPSRLFHIMKSRKEMPTAIIAYDDSVAIDLLHMFWREGLRVPEDISLATFNDVDPVERLNPPLTTISLPGAEIGRTAVEMLLRQIENPSSEQVRTACLPETLVIRESTASPRM